MKRKRLEIPQELIREIWSYVDIDTRVKNKIIPFTVKSTFNYLKPKVLICDDTVNHFNYNYHNCYNLITKSTEISIINEDLIIIYKDTDLILLLGESEPLYFIIKIMFELARQYDYGIVVFG